MENKSWDRDKAIDQLKISSILVIVGGVIGLLMSGDDFVALGARRTSFVFPYFYNILLIGISIFQIVVGVKLKDMETWTRVAVFSIFAARLLLGFYDYGEVLAAFITLGYVVNVLKPSKSGWLFK